MLTEDQKLMHWKAMSFYQYMTTVFDCFVAGGAARNLLMGTAPRDYDLWVASDIQVKDVIEAASNFHKETEGDFTVVVPEIFSEEYPGDVERSDIEFVVRVEVDDACIDVIKMKRPEGKTMQATEILDTFDFPINKFILLPDSNIVGTGHASSPQHAESHLSEGRLDKMRALYPDIEFIDLH